MKLPPLGIKWQCGRCNTWNHIEKGVCSKCGAIAQQYAACFQLQNKLTVEEDNFYKGTSMGILNGIKEIKTLLIQQNEMFKKFIKE